jgi:hypothetical protein
MMPTNVGKLAVAIDQDDLTATSIRTVIIELVALLARIPGQARP